MKKFLLVLFTILSSASINAASVESVVEHVTAPGGKIIYYIFSTPSKDPDVPNMVIKAGKNGNTSFDTLLKSIPSEEPKNNLTGFSNLILSPDAKKLYFQTEAWATSSAIHVIDLTNKKVSYVTNGTLYCVVLSGEYQGYLVVEQHRHYVQGGSYDALWLYNQLGKEISLVSQETDSSQVCPSLGT